MTDLDKDMSHVVKYIKSNLMMEEVKSYNCSDVNIANFEFFNQMDIKTQRNRNDPAVQVPRIAGIYSCLVCRKGNITLNEMRIHSLCHVDNTYKPVMSVNDTNKNNFSNFINLKTYSAMKRSKTAANGPRLKTYSGVKRLKTTNVLPSDLWDTQNDGNEVLKTPNGILPLDTQTCSVECITLPPNYPQTDSVKTNGITLPPNSRDTQMGSGEMLETLNGINMHPDCRGTQTCGVERLIAMLESSNDTQDTRTGGVKMLKTSNSITVPPDCRDTQRVGVQIVETVCGGAKKNKSNIQLCMYKLSHLVPKTTINDLCAVAVYTCLGCNKDGIGSDNIQHHIMCVPWHTPELIQGKLVNWLAASATKLTPVNVSRGPASLNPLPNAPIIKATEIVSGAALLELMRALPKTSSINLSEFPKVITFPENSLVNPSNKLSEVPNENMSCENSSVSPTHNHLELRNVGAIPQNLPHDTSNNQSEFLNLDSCPEIPSDTQSKCLNLNSLVIPSKFRPEFIKGRKRRFEPVKYKLIHLKSCQVVTNAGLVTLYSCTACATENMMFGQLEQHVTCLKPQRLTFQCDGCHKSVFSKKGLRSHRAICRPCKCNSCSEVFPTLGALRAHKKVHIEIGKDHKVSQKPLPKRPLMCKFCSKGFWKLNVLHKHLERHDTTRPQEVHLCHKCGKSFTKMKHLTYHDRMTHMKVIGKWVCETCNKRFHFPSQLKYHMSADHSTDRPFMCDECGKSFSMMGGLRSHMFKQHNPERLLSQRCFQCKACGISFERLVHLVLHKTTHPDHVNEKHHSPVIGCLVCNKMFLTRDRMMQHLCNHKGEHLFNCFVCSAQFMGGYNLFVHWKVGHSKWSMEKLNQRTCTICCKVFLSVISKERHSKIHIPSEQGACNTCGLKYSCKADRWEHEAIHKPQWKYPCPECDRSCKTQDHLQNHLRIHTREKPYSCHLCHRAFPQLSSRNKHMITVHRNESCDIAK